MKIVIASDSFKGSLSSAEAADCIESGIMKAAPSCEIVKICVADGGEGTVESIMQTSGGVWKHIDVTGPMGERVNAKFGLLDNDVAVMEMSSASGLTLINPDSRNPMKATTYGTGELIKAALDLNVKKIIIGIGGSATNDGGAGMAQALGASFTDSDGNELKFGAEGLEKLSSIDISALDARLANVEIIAACDVNNPLYGQNGASHVYGPQKGADPQMVAVLDNNLKKLSDAVKKLFRKDYSSMPGAGAAGGLGFALAAFCKAKIKSGIEVILDAVGIDDLLKDCDLVITGEGRMDEQSAYGKAPAGIAARAKKYDIPVLAIVGSIGEGANAVYECGIDSIMSSARGAITVEESMKNSAQLTEDAAERAIKMIMMGREIEKKIRRKGADNSKEKRKEE